MKPEFRNEIWDNLIWKNYAMKRNKKYFDSFNLKALENLQKDKYFDWNGYCNCRPAFIINLGNRIRNVPYAHKIRCSDHPWWVLEYCFKEKKTPDYLRHEVTKHFCHANPKLFVGTVIKNWTYTRYWGLIRLLMISLFKN